MILCYHIYIDCYFNIMYMWRAEFYWVRIYDVSYRHITVQSWLTGMQVLQEGWLRIEEGVGLSKLQWLMCCDALCKWECKAWVIRGKKICMRVIVVCLFPWFSTEPAEYQHANEYCQSIPRQELGWSESRRCGVTEEGKLLVLLKICSWFSNRAAPNNGTSTYSASSIICFYTI